MALNRGVILSDLWSITITLTSVLAKTAEEPKLETRRHWQQNTIAKNPMKDDQDSDQVIAREMVNGWILIYCEGIVGFANELEIET